MGVWGGEKEGMLICAQYIWRISAKIKYQLSNTHFLGKWSPPITLFWRMDGVLLKEKKMLLLLIWENKINHQISRYIISRTKLTDSLPKTMQSKDATNTTMETNIWRSAPSLTCLIKTLFSVHNVPLEKATGKFNAGKYITNGNWPGMSIEPRLGPERKQINRMRLMMTLNTYSTYVPDGICNT